MRDTRPTVTFLAGLFMGYSRNGIDAKGRLTFKTTCDSKGGLSSESSRYLLEWEVDIRLH